jgi:micrococcal nuclease
MYEYKAKLDRVIDGDTVDVILDLGFDILWKTRLRLFGIDTPETRTKDLDEKKRGLAAKQRLIELLPNEFTIQSNDYDRGKYGRVLATLFITNDLNEKVNVNTQLIAEGYAKKYMV